ncbi:MAG: methylmalonyl Co-A mutase-associated GTPase MeaB [Pseudomonadota bacterium]
MVRRHVVTPPRLSLEEISGTGKAAVARALTQVEERADDPTTVALLDEAWLAQTAHIIGLTGPPGVGKSTLIDAMITRYRKAGRTVAVVAVDPSSRRTGGALLGDRTRFYNRAEDHNVFVRSLASRGALGGLTQLAFPSVTLLAALYDYVLVETVGVGQSEAAVSSVAQTVVLCVQPGSGDSLQFMKAGIMEIPDIAVVTKADTGRAARQALSDLAGALSLGAGHDAPIPQLAVSATANTGIDELIDALAAHHRDTEQEKRQATREAQAEAWVREQVEAHFGARGWALLTEKNRLETSRETPFSQARSALERLDLSLRD